MKNPVTHFSLLLCAFLPLLFSGCAGSPKTYTLPEQNDYQGYQIVDAVEKDTVSLSLKKNDKIAVVVRDIRTTSYSYLDPRFANSMVSYEGKSACCAPTSGLLGNTGNEVYKFSFFGKGQTTLSLVSRQKGLSPLPRHFDSDHVLTINVTVQ